MKKVVIFIIFLGGVYAAALSMSSVALKEVIISDGEKEVVELVEVQSALPDDVITYKNSISNNSDKKATDIVLKNPIPKHMTYIGGSAECNTKCDIKFSIDGGASFDYPDNLFVKEEDSQRKARPRDYQVIQWIVSEIKPGVVEDVYYKARLD